MEGTNRGCDAAGPVELLSVSTIADLDPKQRHFLARSLQDYLDEMVRDLDDPDVQEMIEETWRAKGQAAV